MAKTYPIIKAVSDQIKNATTAASNTAAIVGGNLGDILDKVQEVDLAKVPTTRKVNSKALSADIALDKTDIGLGNVDNTSDANKPVSDATNNLVTNHTNRTDNPHTVTKSQVGLGNVDNTSDADKPISNAVDSALDLKADLVDGKVPVGQLPAYVDDVLEYANLAAFPATGESGKIYVALDTNLTYRWGGSAYTEISKSLALGETSTTAYRGDRGKTAYDHSQLTGNAHGTTAAQIPNTPAGTISATTVQAAINELDADRVQLETDLNVKISKNENSINEIKGLNIGIGDAVEIQLYDDSGVWVKSSLYTGTIIPINNFNEVNIKASSLRKTFYSFITSIDTYGKSVSYAVGHSRKEIPINAEEHIIIPQDANFIWIGYKSSGNIIFPESVSFIGIIQKFSDNITSSTENIVSSLESQLNGYYDYIDYTSGIPIKLSRYIDVYNRNESVGGLTDCTDYIPINGSEKIKMTVCGYKDAGTWFGYAWYDENKNYIEGYRFHTDQSNNNALRELIVPAGAIYVRTTFFKDVAQYGPFKFYRYEYVKGISARVEDVGKVEDLSTVAKTIVTSINEINSKVTKYNRGLWFIGDSLMNDTHEGDNWTKMIADNLNRPYARNNYGGCTSSYIKDKAIEAIANNPSLKDYTPIIMIGSNNIDNWFSTVKDIYEIINSLNVNTYMVLSPVLGCWGTPNSGYGISDGTDRFMGGTGWNHVINTDMALQHAFGNSFVNFRMLIRDRWEYGNIKLLSSFTQPPINSSVIIEVSDANWLNSFNPHYTDQVYKGIVIGKARQGIVDKYSVNSVIDETHIDVTLVECNYIVPGSVVDNLLHGEYTPEGDPTPNTSIYYLDVWQTPDYYSYIGEILPSSFRTDGIHFFKRNSQEFIAKIIEREISSRNI